MMIYYLIDILSPLMILLEPSEYFDKCPPSIDFINHLLLNTLYSFEFIDFSLDSLFYFVLLLLAYMPILIYCVYSISTLFMMFLILCCMQLIELFSQLWLQRLQLWLQLYWKLLSQSRLIQSNRLRKTFYLFSSLTI